MLLQRCCEFRSFGSLHRNEVFNRQCIQHLPTEALSDHAGGNAFTRGVNRRCGTGWAAAHHQYVKIILRIELFCGFLIGIRIELGHDFFNRHAPLAELHPIHKRRWYGHDAACFDLILKIRAINHGVADVRIQNRHQVQRLNDFRTVVARQGNESFKVHRLVQAFDLLDQLGIGFRRMTAHLQQGQDQRGELVPHRNTGKLHARRLANARHAKGWAQGRRTVFAHAHFIGQRGDVIEQAANFRGFGAVIQRCDQFNRVLQFLQIGF